MKQYGKFKRLCFDDILLVPQNSDIESRRLIDLRGGLSGTTPGIALSVPLIAAPMDTVCEYEMAVAMRQQGGLGILHRYMDIDKQVIQFKMASAYGALLGAAIGATGDYLQRAHRLVTAGCKVLLIDTANGHSKYAIDAVKAVSKAFPNVHIMAGNVSTYEGFARLQDAGAHSIRVGIGGGSVCTTRLVSGHGVPTLASIMDIRERIPYGEGASLIADGGIRTAGDAAKALAAGADVLMVGSMLAGTDEAPGELVDGKFKRFRGMASEASQIDFKGSSSVVEGISTLVPYKGSVKGVIDNLVDGLGSALSYSGAKNLKEFYENAEYIRVTHSSLTESRPHARD
jgi:IMP dehydrogenase